MKSATKAMMNAIDEVHDWSYGQTWGGSGTQLSRTDTCRVCLLERRWCSDTQNGNHGETTYVDGETGEQLSLRQAHARGCAERGES